MAIERSATLYPKNATVVDSGGGVDIRILRSTNAGTNDATQTVQATHTQDNVNRTFDPATGAVTAAANPGALQKLGWATRLTEDTTPDDDTNCNAILTAGTGTLTIDVTINQSGGTYAGGTYAPQFAYGLFRYNPATDTGTLITFGTTTGTSWTVGGIGSDLGTFKTATMSIVIPAGGQELAQGEILLLQIGLNTQTIPNPTLGTATWTYTLRVDDANTNIAWAANQGLAQICRVSEQGRAAANSTAQKYVRLGARSANAAADAEGARALEGFRAGAAASAARASVERYVRLAAKSAASAARAAASRWIRLVPAQASSAAAAAAQKYVRLTARQASAAASAAGSRALEIFRAGAASSVAQAAGVRVLEAVRVGSAASVAVAEMYVKIKQDILNRLAGGTIIRRRGKVIVYDKV